MTENNAAPKNEYDLIKAQISFAVTGSQAILCPHCGKNATAHVSGKIKDRGWITRHVRTACRHCGTIFTFIWR